MDTQKVDMFMLTNGKYFREEKIMLIRDALEKADEKRWPLLSSLSFKDPVISLVLSLLLGGLGIDRFYMGDTGLGVGKLLTCGGAGIWTIVDWFLVMGSTKDKNFEKLSQILV